MRHLPQLPNMLCSYRRCTPAGLHRTWLLGCVINEAAQILSIAPCILIRGPVPCI